MGLLAQLGGFHSDFEHTFAAEENWPLGLIPFPSQLPLY